MDPITIALVAPLSSGVLNGTAEAGKSLIVDAYTALRDDVKHRCGADSPAPLALRLPSLALGEHGGVHIRLPAAGGGLGPNGLRSGPGLPLF